MAAPGRFGSGLSRLFESFGDGAENDIVPDGSPLSGEPDVLMPEGEFDDPIFGEGQDALALEPPKAAPPAVRETAGKPKAKLTLETPPPSYEIPDFERDEKDVESYEDAKRRYSRQQISSAETAIQTSFAQKREQLSREIKNGRSFDEERRAAAMHTTRQYANAYPRRVDKRGVNPPGFWENIFSFGRAGRLYRAAIVATEALEQLRAAMRKREEQLAALDDQMKRAIYLKEESIKKALETEAGLAEFHERPEIKSLYARTEKIGKEREEYAKRLERGVVSDAEQRDRAMGEQKIAWTELPVMGAIIGKVARFGQLSYFQLRDLERKEMLLSYDPRLDPLRNCVFDIYAVAGSVAAKLKRNDNGTAFRVADHFKACWRNQEKAEELYGQHRAALREDRGLEPMEPRTEGEAEIIARLAGLAEMVDGGGQTRADGAQPQSGASAH
jgi:hypothetical protein